jgi:arginyl-tRNA synthetase
MTNYDKLVDAISNEIYLLNVSHESWDEESAKNTSKRILEIVEEFQQKRSNIIP